MGRVVVRSRALLEAKCPLSHAFYTSGQLMIEEYYTLAVIGKAGIGPGRPRPAAAGMRGPAADQGPHRRRHARNGHDLATGAPASPVAYRARHIEGRATPKTVTYEHPLEDPDETYPLRLTTGRTVYHWHMRTKTRRSRALDDAPAMWVELSEPDARRLGIAEGDIVRVTSRRGSIEAPSRISHPREGVVFAPWHYGEVGTAVNELTLTG
ncbi:molybdopterin oxidoreductase family protein [Streptomyces sp. NPDC001817]|uniref:molybdopterin oxidoreductase family protein n=1 Tax=Streptomyces sp. NPDC001817 TaxID=3154398 RepID=UPI003318CE86